MIKKRKDKELEGESEMEKRGQSAGVDSIGEGGGRRRSVSEGTRVSCLRPRPLWFGGVGSLLLIWIVLVGGLQGCSLGPMTSHETAQTVDVGKHEIVFGYGFTGATFRWNYGLIKNLDLGFYWEFFSYGLRGKYLLMDGSKSGMWSLALALGTGSSGRGVHYYGDLTASRRSGSWEPYGTLRVVRVDIRWDDYSDGEKSWDPEFPNLFKVGQFYYGQIFAGTRYWINTHWLFSMEGAWIFHITPDFAKDTSLLNLAFGYHF